MPLTETGKKLMATVAKEILIIEDSPTIRGFLRKTLETNLEGCIVHEAEDGKTAVRELTQSRVHLIITDLQMPGMGGCEFLKMIRNNPILAKKPVIVLTGEDCTELKKEYASHQDIIFLKKPAPREEIMIYVKKLLNM
jgi:two-component system, chemotaxis family, chemotaxis protein CheY